MVGNMSQTFTPFGLSYNTYEGGKEALTLRTYQLSNNGKAQSLGLQDVVTFSEVAGDAGLSALPAAVAAAAYVNPNVANYIVGKIEGFWYLNQQGTYTTTKYWAGGTPVFNNGPVNVILNALPNSTFLVQANSPFPNGLSAVGANLNLVQNGGASGVQTPASLFGANSSSGQSQQYLISGAFLGAGTLAGHCKVLSLASQSSAFPNQSWADPYPVVVVRINTHFFGAPTPSVY
jgi:hypothetical protein